MHAPSRTSRRRTEQGFTLIELLITVLLMASVVAAIVTVLFTAARSKTSSVNGIEASQAGRVALDMMARDLRSAGYGCDRDYVVQPQPPIAYIDSLQVLINENLQPYPDTSSAGPGYPKSYDPNGNPRPFPLNGTPWQPPIQYTKGAEIVRWTLDTNNDGVVDANDLSAPDDADAARTPNPNDYELVRQVYGDLGGGSNGGTTQRVALVRVPGGGVPPMFQVYMKGSSTPWNWSSGPVPASQLSNIERVTIQVVAPSGKPDWRGNYASSTFRTDVNSLRNVPDFGAAQYAVDGFVFQDANHNGVRDLTEPGVSGARVRLGPYSFMTSANGYFLFQVPAGSYVLKHTPPGGYVSLSHPDSVTITVPPATSHSFPDSLVPGGWIKAFAWNDANNNGLVDAGERGMVNVKLALSPLNTTAYTDTGGRYRFFAPLGGWTLTATAPDSFVVTTTNPVSGTLAANGDSATVLFGLYQAQIATLKGTVYRDNNRNGVLDAGEVGVQGVWVGVTTDGGITVPGFATTDANGQYSITVPVNDPPHTTPYSLMIIPPPGYFPTSSSAINNLWLQNGVTLSNQNFGVAAFTVITLNANRVLSLASGDLVEKDWNGSQTQNAHGDEDIVLGSDTGGTDQVSVWFNQWQSTPLFNATPDYTRSAPGAVMAMALNYFDVDSPQNRPDLVTGCKAAAAGNFFVWWCQNSSGNLGFFPSSYSQAYRTNDNGDVQAIVSGDFSGGAGADFPDLVVGTKSPTANFGTFELWTNNNAASPTFSRTEIYPPSGGLVAGGLGEVNAIVAKDLDGDGLKDLVVGTHTGTYTGQVYIFKNMGKLASPHFLFQSGWTFGSEAINALAVTDVDGDGAPDIVAGTQSSTGGGHLVYLKNRAVGGMIFDYNKSVNAPGIVTSLLATDLGGGPGKDLAVGWRQSSASFVGGTRVYFLDSGTVPASGVDPSAGSLVNWVPALCTDNFNYGTNPAAVAPFLPDLAAGVKISSTTGALVVFIR